MGWDGHATFEELIDGRWTSRGSIDVRVLTYRAANAIDAPFVNPDDTDREDMQAGTFMWNDFVSASDANNDIGSYRSADEVIDRIRDEGNHPLASALQVRSRVFRVVVDISH